MQLSIREQELLKKEEKNYDIKSKLFDAASGKKQYFRV